MSSKNNIAISVKNLSKAYKLYNNPVDRMKESLHPLRKKYHHDFFALNDVSFEVKKGETVGIIGKNGSGKSTLLKVITGVLTPSSGTVQVNGKVSALLELGAGFNPEFTGIENVYFNGSIMGYTRAEMDAKIDDILSFADIGEFINQPVKTYSSGMFVRLAFAIATCVDPEILIIDEALSVGDMFFQAKSMAKMTKMINEKQVTLIFVSHDINAVISICKNVVWLDMGKVKGIGNSDDVVTKYSMYSLTEKHAAIYEESKNKINDFLFESNDVFQKNASYDRYRNGKSQFNNAILLNSSYENKDFFEYNENVILRMSIAVEEDLPLISCGYSITNKNGVAVLGTNSIVENRYIVSPRAGKKYVVDFLFNLPLQEGFYNILISHSVPVSIELGEIDVCDRIPCAIQFEMKRKNNFGIPALVKLDNVIRIEVQD